MQNGALIAKIRTDRGLSQREVAHDLKIALTVYKLYETNVRAMNIEDLNKLSNYFKISLNTLLGLSDNLKFFGNFDIDYKYLKFSLKYVRKIHRVSQKELSKDLKVSIQTISKFEKHPEDTNASYLRAFALKFHVSVDYICGKTLKKEVL